MPGEIMTDTWTTRRTLSHPAVGDNWRRWWLTRTDTGTFVVRLNQPANGPNVPLVGPLGMVLDLVRESIAANGLTPTVE